MTAKNYNALVSGLLADVPLNELGPGQPCRHKHDLLLQLTDASLVEPHVPRDRRAALACCAGLWLRYNFLDESHRISQDLETPEGSFWHGIMHRREGDFGNAKYWFRRVGDHPLFAELAIEAATLSTKLMPDEPTEFISNGTQWDPYRFIDLCEHALGTGSKLEELCREVQRREWDLLFDYCYRHAVAI